MPAPGERRRTALPPWWPTGLQQAVRNPAKLGEQWQYVLVEEVVGAVAELMCWPWPCADQYGRLVWDDDAEDRVSVAVVPQRLLSLQLYKSNNLRRRPRPGDTFAARITTVQGWGQDAPVADLATIFPGAVYDVSADAREAAKLAYHGSSAAVFHESQAEGLLLDARAQRERRPRAKRLKVTSVDAINDDEELP